MLESEPRTTTVDALHQQYDTVADMPRSPDIVEMPCTVQWSERAVLVATMVGGWQERAVYNSQQYPDPNRPSLVPNKHHALIKTRLG